MRLKSLLLVSCATLFLFSCKKENNPDSNKELPDLHQGSIKLIFENYVGSQPLVYKKNSLANEDYINANGDTFSVNEYKYYVSNFIFTDIEGKQHAVPESYYLIDHGNPASLSYEIKEIPEGSYTKVQFLIGVDSLHNVSGAQNGALDPIHGMFWEWNSGYIMAKLEGKSPQSTTSIQHISYHMGGFHGPYSSVKEVILEFPEHIELKEEKQPSLTLRSDILKWFEGNHIIDFAEFPQTMNPNSSSAKIAENYQYMFSISNITQ